MNFWKLSSWECMKIFSTSPTNTEESCQNYFVHFSFFSLAKYLKDSQDLCISNPLPFFGGILSKPCPAIILVNLLTLTPFYTGDSEFNYIFLIELLDETILNDMHARIMKVHYIPLNELFSPIWQTQYLQTYRPNGLIFSWNYHWFKQNISSLCKNLFKNFLFLPYMQVLEKKEKIHLQRLKTYDKSIKHNYM